MLFARRMILPATIAVLALLIGAGSAGATYPGVNGKIYFHACDVGCGYDIWAVNPDGSGLENVTDVVTEPEGPPEVAFYPSVSANGKVMAFGVDSQATSEIWVMNTDGTGAHQLTEDNLLDQEPAISPDGSRIVWNQWSPFPGYTDRDIWTMNADGSGQELFFNGSGEDYFPEFTSDGQFVVMGSETGDLDIRKVPAATAAPPLTEATGVAEDDEFLENEPSVSPDGSTVAFTQVPTSTYLGPRDIYSVSIDGGTSNPLFDTNASETSPAYSPDGTKIVFSRDGVAMIGNADGSGTPAALDIGPLNSVGGFDWAPAPPPAPGPPGGGEVTDDSGLAPATKLGKHPPKRTRKRLAKFTFSSSEAGSSFECKLDKKPFRACSSPVKKKVKVGKHRFQVRAVGAQGKTDPTPAIFRWRVLRPS
jgi:WD40-like Beta Propeller Repeat